jgi:hypothetical protein
MIHDKVNVNWTFCYNSDRLLGYLPVFDEDFRAISYYSCENMHPEAEHRRVVPCYHYHIWEDWMTSEEEYYMQETLSPKTSYNSVLHHEIYRDDYIKNYNENKFVVMFVGCDDGDKFMRFKDRESAIEFLESITYYDEIFDTQVLLMSNY